MPRFDRLKTIPVISTKCITCISTMALTWLIPLPAYTQDESFAIPSTTFDEDIYAVMDRDDPTASETCKTKWRNFLRRSENMAKAEASLKKTGNYTSGKGDHAPVCRSNALHEVAQDYYAAGDRKKVENLHRAEMRIWDTFLENVNEKDLHFVYQIQGDRESTMGSILLARAKQIEGFNQNTPMFSTEGVKQVIPDAEKIFRPYHRNRIIAQIEIDKLEVATASQHNPDECIEYCGSIYDETNWGHVKRNAEDQYKLHVGWLEKLPSISEEEPISCTDLADQSQNMSEDMFWAYEKWDKLEAEYLSFYNSSQVKLETDFDKTHYELPSVVPFSGSLNSQFKVQTNTALRHMPSVKMSITSEAMAEFNKFMTLANDLKDIAGKFGIKSDWIDGAMKATGDWTGYWTNGATETELPYDEGVSAYRKIMQERQITLDNYRRHLNLYVCKAIVPAERDIFEMRTKTVAESKCSPSEIDSMEGWLSRHTSYRNEVQLQRVESYCKTYEASARP